MLQQTQVARVVPRFTGFLDLFPTPTACAAAPVGEVLRAWHGLGYNRRARNLHAAATRIVGRHGGEVPSALDELEALPGVGRYTARAVASLAYDLEVGVLDTNAARVLARAVAGRSLRPAEAQRLADDTVPPGRARDWNQAVMDLGATVCRKRRPDCGGCPVVDVCAWAARGWPEPDPADGTAGSSRRQSTFEGSDRQGRGRLVDALRSGPVPLDRVPDAIGWPDDPDRALRVVHSLIADGLAEVADGTVALPA